MHKHIHTHHTNRVRAREGERVRDGVDSKIYKLNTLLSLFNVCMLKVFSIATLNIKTNNITKLSIKTLSIMGLFATLSIKTFSI
jgi:hypothetical protein